MANNKRLKVISKRGLGLLRLDTNKWKAVEETRLGGTRFSLTFPHKTARRARPRSLALIVVKDELPSLRAGLSAPETYRQCTFAANL